MELTADQRAVVDHPAPCLAVTGGPGTGRTTALHERYHRVAAEAGAGRVLVVCRDRGAAARFRSAVLPRLAGGFDALPITTVHGLAYDLVSRSGRDVRLVGGAERRALLRRLLAAQSAADWPELGHLLGRPAFFDEVLAGLACLDDTGSGDPSAAGGRWAELARFRHRYRAALEAAQQVDGPQLLEDAERLAAPGRFAHVLIDDVDARGLVAAVAGQPPATVELTRPFRARPPGRVVVAGHPSIEAEAVAGELIAAHRDGVAWPDMAVVTRRLGRRRRSIARALARHGIPAVPVPALAADDPVVRAVTDLLRWVDGDEAARDRLLSSPLADLVGLHDALVERLAAGDTPADLAYEVWSRALADIQDDRTLDAVVSFVDGLARFADRNPRATLSDTLAAIDDDVAQLDPWRTAPPAGADGVTLTSIAGAAGREWHTVVVAGCVEGELPHVRVREPLFDPAELGVPRPSLADERQLWAVATSRATGQLIATAAPEPGVLVSRFVEDWEPAPVRLPFAPGQPAVRRAPTAGAAPVWPGGRLTLSASQLDTYDDCPLRYAFQYALHVRDEAGVHAGLGNLVHTVLATFLDPEAADPPPRTLDGLLAVADELWSDDIARYRPQREEVRRDLVEMLTRWWEATSGEELDVVAVEREFGVDVGPHRLRGFIDRVDRTPEGLRVIDYKTGKREPPPGDVADDIQLAVYHLATELDPELAAQGVATRLELQYLRTMHRLAQPIGDDHAARTTARVLAAADQIVAEELEPALDATCRTCSYHRLCPLQPAGRQVGGE